MLFISIIYVTLQLLATITSDRVLCFASQGRGDVPWKAGKPFECTCEVYLTGETNAVGTIGCESDTSGGENRCTNSDFKYFKDKFGFRIIECSDSKYDVEEILYDRVKKPDYHRGDMECGDPSDGNKRQCNSVINENNMDNRKKFKSRLFKLIRKFKH
ncbi:hypothetical protein K502DRAFT_326447 [Neoconidiobolus thromboides FSU 785]|nr:hypothetical protein K502DRAFT_326447 [Neoconidiobolus thromboides FSU 785]